MLYKCLEVIPYLTLNRQECGSLADKWSQLQAILRASLDHNLLSVEKFSRWLRAICTISIARDTPEDRLKAIGYVEHALTVIEDHNDSDEVRALPSHYPLCPSDMFVPHIWIALPHGRAAVALGDGVQHRNRVSSVCPNILASASPWNSSTFQRWYARWSQKMVWSVHRHMSICSRRQTTGGEGADRCLLYPPFSHDFLADVDIACSQTQDLGNIYSALGPLRKKGLRRSNPLESLPQQIYPDVSFGTLRAATLVFPLCWFDFWPLYLLYYWTLSLIGQSAILTICALSISMLIHLHLILRESTTSVFPNLSRFFFVPSKAPRSPPPTPTADYCLRVYHILLTLTADVYYRYVF